MDTDEKSYPCESVINFVFLRALARQSPGNIMRREDFGVRWQPAGAKRSEDWSAAATPIFDCGPSFQSGVALRFPPQSKIIWVQLGRAAPVR
jgi:hypothetical protein